MKKRLKIDNASNIVGESVLGFIVERIDTMFGWYKISIREVECDKVHTIKLDRDSNYSMKWNEEEFIIETINGNPTTKSVLVSQLRDKKEFIINMVDLIRLSKV